MSFPADSVLSPDSRICVTGANGLVGSHLVDHLLTFGFRVRGVVRDAQRSSWMQDHFKRKCGPGRFDLIEVKDLGAPGSLDSALQDCEAIAAVASDVSFNPDPTVVVTGSIRLVENMLDAASRNPSIKRVVYTSSAAAAFERMNEPYDLTPDTWCDKFIADAWAPPPYLPARGATVYAAAKAQSEQALFKFAKEKSPHFAVNSVLPDYCVGPPLDRTKQGYPSSMGFFKTLWDGGDSWRLFPGQFMVDVGDAAKLHVAALTHPGVASERVFAYAHPKTWTNWIRILESLYPEHSFPDPPTHEDIHMANVTARPRAEELLNWVCGRGYRPMEDSLKDAGDSFRQDE